MSKGEDEGKLNEVLATLSAAAALEAKPATVLLLGRYLPIPTKPPLCSDLIAPPDSEMISPPGAGAWLAV